jgi:hypothetical protein
VAELLCYSECVLPYFEGLLSSKTAPLAGYTELILGFCIFTLDVFRKNMLGMYWLLREI